MYNPMTFQVPTIERYPTHTSRYLKITSRLPIIYDLSGFLRVSETILNPMTFQVPAIDLSKEKSLDV